MPRTLHTRGQYPANWSEIAHGVKERAGWRCIRCAHPHDPKVGKCLTVHHFDGDKGNCHWWNLLALSQDCHLVIQGRVNPDQPYMFEHSPWLKLYVAGFYAWKYHKQLLTRAEVEARLDELLDLERLDKAAPGAGYSPLDPAGVSKRPEQPDSSQGRTVLSTTSTPQT